MEPFVRGICFLPSFFIPLGKGRLSKMPSRPGEPRGTTQEALLAGRGGGGPAGRARFESELGKETAGGDSRKQSLEGVAGLESGSVKTTHFKKLNWYLQFKPKKIFF